MNTKIINIFDKTCIAENYKCTSFLSIYTTLNEIIQHTPYSVGIDVSGHSSNIEIYSPILHGVIGPGIDGVIASKKDSITLMLRTADCAPVTFCTHDGAYYGIIHIGWKGLINDIIGELGKKLEPIGYSLSDIHIWIGPMAGEGYEFGEVDFINTILPYFKEKNISYPYIKIAAGKISFNFRQYVVEVLKYYKATKISYSEKNTLDPKLGLPSWRNKDERRITTLISPIKLSETLR